MKSLACLVMRDLRLYRKQPGQVVLPWVFFILLVSLFPLAIGPEPEKLRLIGPGVIWTIAQLSVLLGLGGLFTPDVEDGTLEQMFLCGHSLQQMVLAKMIAHWLSCGLPLLVIAPVLGLQFGLPVSSIGMLVLTLVIGTPSLSMLGTFGAALTIESRKSAVLLPLLLLPFSSPVLIFSTGAIHRSLSGFVTDGNLSLLTAFLLVVATTVPWITTHALKIAME